jgi:hypothetical protein
VAPARVVEVFDVVGDGQSQLELVRQRWRLSSSICIEPQNDSMGALTPTVRRHDQHNQPVRRKAVKPAPSEIQAVNIALKS